MQQFIDLKTLSRVKDLPLVAKTLAHGFLHGAHDSRQRGAGIEFSQYRVYEPGDELSKVDWKLFARSDRYFVREAERESEINVWFVVDCSHSMQQSSTISASTTNLNKQEYSKYLLSTMAYLAQNQGDAVGFLALSSNKVHYLPAYSGERHWRKILIALTKVAPGGHFPEIDKVKAQLGMMRKNGLIILISDFHQQNDEVTELACQLGNERTEVVAMHLSSEDEISFPYKGAIRFEDLETKEEILVSAAGAKAEYLATRKENNKSLINKLSANGVQHVAVNIDQPMDESLYQFLNARRKGVK
jgi:uncharacterized protein (DUF58 family)